MPENEDITDIARGMKSLYSESLEDSEASPLYSEICEIEERYIDRTEIARGGMKTIYKVLDQKTDRYIAMAELHEGSSEESFENFIREARLTANLEHPNIISVHDIGLKNNSQPFFTMDLKVGDSLRVILQKLDLGEQEYLARYPLSVLLEIFSKICDAIDYAHSRGVIHLDLKPDNIQIGQHGEVLVCDWGLGKVIGEADSDSSVQAGRLNPDLLNSLTQAGEIKGTPGYMAPEQIETGGKKTCQTDIYALGCLLFSLLTCKTTLSGTLEEMLEATKKGQLQLPSKVRPQFFLPKTLDSIFAKAAALKAENRYTSVKELKNDIANFLAGYSTSVEKGFFFHEAGLFYRRNKTACWTAMSLVLVLFIVTALFIFNLNRRIKEADTANKIASHMSAKQLEEQHKFDKSFKRISGKFLDKIKLMENNSFYSKPISTIEISLKGLDDLLSSGATDDEILNYKLNCLLVKLDLNSVQALSPDGHPLKGLCKKYALMVHKNSLPADELANLIQELNDLVLIEKLLSYQAAANPQTDLSESIVNYLCKLNPGCRKKNISFNPSTKEMRISCPGFKILSTNSTGSSGKSVLRFLDLRKIDFSGSGIKKIQTAAEFNKAELVFDP